MTSPFTERFISVDFFGTLVDQDHHKRGGPRGCSSIALAMRCSTIILPALGGETISPR